MTTQVKPGSTGLLAASVALSLAGTASLALTPLEQLAPAGIDPAAFKWLSLFQPAILAAAAVAIGHSLAGRVGLDAPLLRALVTRQAFAPILKQQLAPAILAGLVAGLILIAYHALAKSYTLAAFELPLAAKLMYGGITEEFIARWGLMSLGVWLAFKTGRRASVPVPLHYWAGNCFAAALFAAGHLPVLLTAAAPSTLIAAAMVGNFLPALLFGWLFQTRGLEAAIMAHMTAHLTASACSVLA